MKNRLLLLIPITILFLTGCGEEEWYCLNGYTLDENTKMCSRTVEVDAKLNYYCEGTGVVLEGKQCKKTDTQMASTRKECNPGYYMDGGLCIKNGTTANYAVCGVNKTYESKTKQCYDKVAPITIYSCTEGVLDGTSCAIVSYSDALTEYVCEDNKYKVYGSKCKYTFTMKAQNTKED